MRAVWLCLGLILDAWQFWVREVWCRTVAGHDYREGVCARCARTIW